MADLIGAARFRTFLCPIAQLCVVAACMAALNLAMMGSFSSEPAGLPFHRPFPWMGFGCNLLVIGLLVGLRKRILLPWRRITTILRHASIIMAGERDESVPGPFTMGEMANTIGRFATHAQEAYNRCRALQFELDASRQTLAQVVAQQQAICVSANRELIGQYRNVLAYANYLDEHIRQHQSDAQLRYDFDDVCESGFNLKLLAQSLELLRRTGCEPTQVPMAALLQQTVIALAPALERRAMRLSTLGIDESLVAKADLNLVAHALWMMLLGTIRYAADESTLKLRCFRGDNGKARISIVISELAPGQLTAEERHAHLLRQLQHITPHMFAETIRQHANARLAELMLSRTGGQLEVTAITSHACEIALVLPGLEK